MYANRELLGCVYSNNINNIIDVSDGLPNQFHFDTAKLNEFLREQCKEVGVILFDDTIDEITYHDNGNVKSVISNKNENGIITTAITLDIKQLEKIDKILIESKNTMFELKL